MPSNSMIVCVTCRVGGKGSYPACVRGGHDIRLWGKHVTVPKRNNTRAWKRIEKGEVRWDRRKVSRRYKQPDEVKRFEFTEEPVELPNGHIVKHRKLIPGSGRMITNYMKRPEVDLGG